MTQFDLYTTAYLGLLVVGIIYVAGAAYYAGTTGEWRPLMIGSIVLGALVVLM